MHAGAQDAVARQRVEGMIDRLLDEVRGLSALLYPRMIGTLGLKGALMEMAGRLHVGKLDVRMEVDDGMDSLDTERSLCVLRVIQEAIINAGRHAGARCVWVSLRCQDGMLRGTVDDDGNGWTGAREGMGLTLMRERARKLGGLLVCESSPQDGARVRFEIPRNPHVDSCPPEL
jgi:signal transduction histidine kinase